MLSVFIFGAMGGAFDRLSGMREWFYGRNIYATWPLFALAATLVHHLANWRGNTLHFMAFFVISYGVYRLSGWGKSLDGISFRNRGVIVDGLSSYDIKRIIGHTIVFAFRLFLGWAIIGFWLVQQGAAMWPMLLTPALASIFGGIPYWAHKHYSKPNNWRRDPTFYDEVATGFILSLGLGTMAIM